MRILTNKADYPYDRMIVKIVGDHVITLVDKDGVNYTLGKYKKEEAKRILADMSKAYENGKPVFHMPKEKFSLEIFFSWCWNL